MFRIISIVIIFGICCDELNAAVYKWVDEDGQVHFSQEKPKNKNATPIRDKSNSGSGLRVYLFPFGSDAKFRVSKKIYCDEGSAQRSLRKKLSSYYARSTRYGNEFLERHKNVFKSAFDKKAFLYEMSKKCEKLESEKILDQEIYDIGKKGIKRILKFENKKERFYGSVYVNLSRYENGKFAKSACEKNYNSLKNTKYNQKKLKARQHGYNVVIINDGKKDSFACIPLENVLIKIFIRSNKYREMQYLQSISHRYTKWLSKI